MDKGSLVKKSAFFIAICLFVGMFSSIFGEENSLVGVTVVVLALMMFGKDLSVKPLWNLGGLLAIMLSMGLGSYASLLNPFLGVPINLVIVFLTSYCTTRNLRTPLHFPFLLGYAFLLSVPVSPEELDTRIAALVTGSVLIVALNVLVNRKTREGTSHGIIITVCGHVKDCIKGVRENGTHDTTALNTYCAESDAVMRDRLNTLFFTESRDRRVLETRTSLQNLGNAVYEGGCPDGLLRDLESLMGIVESFEKGESDASEVSDAVDRILSSHGCGYPVVSSLRLLQSSLTDPEKPPIEPVKNTLINDFRTDSLGFSFGVRMAILFTFCVFVWQYYGLDNAQWMLYAIVALVQPYTDSSWKKATHRMTGTLMGVILFVIVCLTMGSDPIALGATVLILGYVYMLVDPKRYDVMMMFITAMVLTGSVMADPMGDAVTERIAYTLLGVVLATASNYLLLPYRMRDENIELCMRYLKTARRGLDDVVNGRDPMETAMIITESSGISRKLHMNCPDDPVMGRFLAEQDGLMAEIRLLKTMYGHMDGDDRDEFLKRMAGAERRLEKNRRTASDVLMDMMG